MRLMQKIASPNDWLHYENRLLSGFRRANIQHKKLRDVFKLMKNISNLMISVMREEVEYRRDHKEIHEQKIDEYYQQANQLLEILNDNFILEILLSGE